jgi:hypothetical protein
MRKGRDGRAADASKEATANPYKETNLADKMPPVNQLIGGELAWRQHDGGHTNIPNFPALYEWAGRYISSPGLTKKK